MVLIRNVNRNYLIGFNSDITREEIRQP
jgi:hypothetical protein